MTAPHGFAFVGRATDTIRRLQAQRDELRAVLAPLLENPLATGDGSSGVCFFCLNTILTGSGHALACPVLRRSELLGYGPE